MFSVVIFSKTVRKIPNFVLPFRIQASYQCNPLANEVSSCTVLKWLELFHGKKKLPPKIPHVKKNWMVLGN